MQEALSIKRSGDNREVYEYPLPDEIKGTDPLVKTSFGLVKLKMSQEVQASESARGNQARLAYAWLRASLVEVDGRRIRKEDGEDESILENVDPVIRELMLDAYTDMSSSKGVDTKKFLGSRKIKSAT